ncbi:MAG: heat-shock protein Hsp70 [SAR324 cluster bacterium]|uniref:Heat-shock protein Hsp70 n=1 Tax=SAR324 cluster bacterium TaxID=2024889 RepID=A0A2A4STA4_9DELT|nr:MAG: heat-shock protein Hsp70 [SAR324 cluster bacterium]
MEKIIGIDLGTTNSLVAVIEQGKCTVIPDHHGNLILPSFVGMSKEGQLLVGEEARRQYVAVPQNTVKSVKRKMGTDHQYQMLEKDYSATEISAIILKTLKERATAYFGEEIRKAIITVPAYFSDAQRQATKDAGEIAGLEVTRILNEPTAAAVAYQFDSQETETILVYDLGGGTFDVSIVEISDGITEVLSSHGNNLLGGDDFDLKLAHWLEERFYQSNQIRLFDNPVTKARLLRAAESAKITLSEHIFVDVAEQYIARQGKKALHLQEKITRMDFEELIMPLLEQTTDALDQALKDAELEAEDIDRVILVGGSTRIPMVRTILENHLQQEVFDLVNPDLCVALGAGYHAGTQAGEEIDSVLVDVTPYSLGVRSGRQTDYGFDDNYFSVIIPRNTVIPCTKSDIFTNPMDDMKKVMVAVYQGEQTFATGNIHLGSFDILNLPTARSNELKIEVSFDFDINGILNVTAKEKNSKQEFSIHLHQSSTRMATKQITKARNRLDDLFEEASQPIIPMADVIIPKTEKKMSKSIRDLCHKAEIKAESLEDKEEAKDILDLVSNIKECFWEEDDELLETLVGELNDILYYLDND